MLDLEVSEKMRGEIREFLKEVEAEYNVRILYACESGSRAWGFASPDSDYDIRFIYVSNAALGDSQGSERSTIEIPIENDLDAGGWSVKKALTLLKKSNGALIEWLHSPIVYYAEDGFLDEWRETSRSVLAEWNLVAHYRGHAKQLWKTKLQQEQVSAKSYLYALRTLLSSEWILARRSNPPVPFSELLELTQPTLRAEIDVLLSKKSVSGEKSLMANIPQLDKYIESALEDDSLENLPQAKEHYPEIDVLFHRWTGRASRISHMGEINLARAKKHDLLLFRSVAGSQAYGTSHAGSDVDFRGVFSLPRHLLGSLETLDQVQDERGDDVLFELGKVMAMLQKNNPNMMELLYMPKECIEYQHPVWSLLKPEYFLSKKCELSFANYAVGQVKKARGLNKKIVNPEPEARREFIDFCYVLQGQGSVPLSEWAKKNEVNLQTLGLVSSQHAPNTYSLYCDREYRGAFSQKASDEIICSSVAIDAVPAAWMVCNYDAYKKHCKSHKEYWAWVRNRNEDRYQTSNSAGYDAKNMMHTLRLLDVAEEIAREGVLHVRRPNADFLMEVRSGSFEYEYLLSLAEEKMESVREAYASCDLPDEPSFEFTNDLLIEMRQYLA